MNKDLTHDTTIFIQAIDSLHADESLRARVLGITERPRVSRFDRIMRYVPAGAVAVLLVAVGVRVAMTATQGDLAAGRKMSAESGESGAAQIQIAPADAGVGGGQAFDGSSYAIAIAPEIAAGPIAAGQAILAELPETGPAMTTQDYKAPDMPGIFSSSDLIVKGKVTSMGWLATGLGEDAAFYDRWQTLITVEIDTNYHPLQDLASSSVTILIPFAVGEGAVAEDEANRMVATDLRVGNEIIVFAQSIAVAERAVAADDGTTASPPAALPYQYTTGRDDSHIMIGQDDGTFRYTPQTYTTLPESGSAPLADVEDMINRMIASMSYTGPATQASVVPAPDAKTPSGNVGTNGTNSARTATGSIASPPTPNRAGTSVPGSIAGSAPSIAPDGPTAAPSAYWQGPVITEDTPLRRPDAKEVTP